jgi:uridylate kinase
MDLTAFTLCQEHKLPILVVDFWSENDLFEAVRGNHEVGTLISDSE